MTLHVPRFENVRIAVIGDVMLDHYWHGDTSRISPEAPVAVVAVRDTETRAGGAANVARNVAALDASVRLAGVVGDDDAGRILAAGLEDSSVQCRFHCAPGFETIIKTRIISRHQQLLRLDRESPVPAAGAAAMVQGAAALLEGCDALILSDYGKGSLGGVGAIVDIAREAACPVLVDPKGRDFRRYAGATVLTPNQSEFEALVGRCDGDDAFAARGSRLASELNLEALLITRGEHGMTLVRAGGGAIHLRAEAREVFDVTGAGDTVIAALSCGLAAGATLEDASRIANLAAGLVVSKLGASTVGRAELVAAMADGTAARIGQLDLPSLLDAVETARSRGERIVMTNGCFDLLHAGHVTYLEQARRLGDRLVVAINDDASVRRLKGPGRPLNPLAARSRVLAALKSVDWVISFAEPTPEQVVARVLPDVLVKGGDYTIEQIAGAELVLANGGSVKVIDFVPGYSTTGLLARARQAEQ